MGIKTMTEPVKIGAIARSFSELVEILSSDDQDILERAYNTARHQIADRETGGATTAAQELAAQLFAGTIDDNANIDDGQAVPADVAIALSAIDNALFTIARVNRAR